MLTFTYVPAAQCVELKSLKLYLQQFRNEGIFYEHATNRILDDLVAVVQPRRMTLHGRLYAARRHHDHRHRRLTKPKHELERAARPMAAQYARRPCPLASGETVRGTLRPADRPTA